ncbi:hypothetical protein BC829DRAFT_387473 [Chytridium lagenaria]|nr:hypothetical protein BC829DRAFT_387473 [Chytridium lagenaria]
MAEIVLAGRADDAEFAKAEAMAYHLAHNLPDYKVEVIMKTPDEWEDYRDIVYEENRWGERRASDREIKPIDSLQQMIWRKSGELIGNTSDFLKLVGFTENPIIRY